jgi:hypothetical protein
VEPAGRETATLRRRHAGLKRLNHVFPDDFAGSIGLWWELCYGRAALPTSRPER